MSLHRRTLNKEGTAASDLPPRLFPKKRRCEDSR